MVRVGWTDLEKNKIQELCAITLSNSEHLKEKKLIFIEPI